MLINFSLIVKQAIFADVNHAWIRSSWDQPVLSNEGKVYCSRKQRGPLIGLELTTDRHPPIMNQTCYPLRHAAPFKTLTGGEMPITLPETQMIMRWNANYFTRNTNDYEIQKMCLCMFKGECKGALSASLFNSNYSPFTFNPQHCQLYSYHQ